MAMERDSVLLAFSESRVVDVLESGGDDTVLPPHKLDLVGSPSDGFVACVTATQSNNALEEEGK